MLYMPDDSKKTVRLTIKAGKEIPPQKKELRKPATPIEKPPGRAILKLRKPAAVQPTQMPNGAVLDDSGREGVSPKQTRPARVRKRLRLFPVLLITAALLLLAGFISIFSYISNLDVSKLAAPLPDSTFILDRSGQKASQLSSSRIEPVPLAKIPLHLRNAIIATEDRRFYDHQGVDIQGILRALIRDIRSKEFAEGGSTITQQLAKNQFLPTDKTLGRKLKEAAYAFKIDVTFSKDEILEMYLNSIYFGEGSYGVQGASQEYFAKNAENLTLEESALLAGMPKAPSMYSPIKNKEAAIERRNTVLALMKEQNFISQTDYDTARKMPIAIKKMNEQDLKGKYPSYIDYVFQEAMNVYGFTEEQILTGGLQIYTEMDPVVQTAAQEVYKDAALFPQSKPDQLLQSGVAIIDPKTGGVRGLVGNRGDGVFRGFNRATQLVRQPGSALKPLIVYGPALDRGYTPASILYDSPLDINGYKPRDWDNQTRGYVTLADAVTWSWNIPAVWLLHEMGIDAGLSYAQKAGIPLTASDRTYGAALGGLSGGVSPLQMAQAFGSFANLGTMQPARAITKIATKDGHVLVEAQPKPVQVTTPQNAYMMTALLQNVVLQGTGTNAILGRPVAGKTGTTQLPATKEFEGITGQVSKDGWFVGYTPELVAAVWLGYDRTDREHYLEQSGSASAAAVFREIMKRALKDKPIVPFPAP
jgi:penicillin-binding protein 2A